MVDATRALLDELMGRERNVPLTERTNRELTFHSPEVCKYAIAGLCPYGLFRNTKSDLGKCKYEVHDEPLEIEDVTLKWSALQKEWDALPTSEKLRCGYEAELLQLLEQLVREMDRKIERQKERAIKDNAPREPGQTERAELDELQARERELLENSERLAESGDVDASLALAKQLELTREEYAALLKKATERDRTMTVCDVCGVFMTSTDSEARREEHLAGKQYMGWLNIRDKLAILRKQLGPGGAGQGLPPPPDSRERPREREPERKRERDYNRDSRDYNRDSRDQRDSRDHRDSREGGRERGRHDERARSPRRRSQDREREQGSYPRRSDGYERRRERDY